MSIWPFVNHKESLWSTMAMSDVGNDIEFSSFVTCDTVYLMYVIEAPNSNVSVSLRLNGWLDSNRTDLYRTKSRSTVHKEIIILISFKRCDWIGQEESECIYSLRVSHSHMEYQWLVTLHPQAISFDYIDGSRNLHRVSIPLNQTPHWQNSQHWGPMPQRRKQ